MIRKRLAWLGLLVVVLAGCASANPSVVATGDAPGFWWGLWNGITLPVSFFGSLFSDSVGIYETVNSGSWYDFGFWLGAGSCGGGLRTIFGSGRRS